MNDKPFLATYFNGNNYSYDWLEDEDDVNNWIDENKDIYINIEIIEVRVIKTLYESK